MKRLLIALLVTVCIVSIASCGGGSYKDNVPTGNIASGIVASIGSPADYSLALDGYLDDYFEIPDYVTESTVICATSGNNIDEVGVFHVSGGHAADMEKLLSDYLSGSYRANQQFYDSYIPEETPKLRDAELRVFGNYLVYVILSPAARDTAFQTAEGLLKE